MNKSLYRRIRYNPLVEMAQYLARREEAIHFPEINLSVPAGPGDIIIDAGANVGDIASRCARTGATVHAFEPGPLCFAILVKRFTFLRNVKVQKLGLMDSDCELALTTPSPHDHYDEVEMTLCSSFVAPPIGAMVETPAKCIDIAKFIRSLPRPVTLLKMDIEGAEIPVINHLIDTGAIDRVKMAVVETHERLSPELAVGTEQLRTRIAKNGLSERVRLDWV